MTGPVDAPLHDLATRSASRLAEYRVYPGDGTIPAIPSVVLTSPAATSPTAVARPAIDITELFIGAGPVFVRHCYQMILRRDPDPVGASALVDSLVTGCITRLDVIRSLRYSDEGRRIGIEIRGLGWRSAINRLLHLPVIGYVLRLGTNLLRLPRSTRVLEGEIHNLWRRIDELEQRSDAGDGR